MGDLHTQESYSRNKMCLSKDGEDFFESMGDLHSYCSSNVIEDLKREREEDACSCSSYDANNAMTESELCIPQDPIEALDWYPNFGNSFISMNDISFENKYDFEVTKSNKTKMTRPEITKPEMTKPEITPLKQSNIMNVLKDEEEEQRKCSHCEATTTPQWRKGPKGPNTLCNACGIRYKKGGLLPEYRPAASPTFNKAKHSNFDRKILKMKSRFVQLIDIQSHACALTNPIRTAFDPL
ncbi:Zinc finger, GATA-type [Dillenia turbinata]|uniref:Zinc finger, GATA-type n=1 Tax=Dillenia turbinata TaxID=194707 RepID=A0AAN8V8Y5_9MAGN